jgi:hypothetical protein
VLWKPMMWVAMVMGGHCREGKEKENLEND